MNRPNIGGPLTASAYTALAEQNRPAEPMALEAEVRRLHTTGLTARDIAVALRLPPDRVLNMLGVGASPPARMAGPSESGASAVDQQLSLVERRIIELQARLKLLQVERCGLLQQLEREAAYD
jgi:hypothetical protein